MSSQSKVTVELLQAASRSLAQKDSTVWGDAARELAHERLGWIDLPERSRELLPALDALAAWARSLNRNRFVLSGMGGSSLAPEVIAATFQNQISSELVILDSTHPADVRKALDTDPANSLFIISSKSGETIETLSHLKAIEARLHSANLRSSDHMVVISDPQSPLAQWAHDHQIRFFAGEPTVGGRFSALSIFGLLPAALLGVDCAMLLDDAADMKKLLSEGRAESLANALVIDILEHQPFLELTDQPLSDWIEQLIAESTGKAGLGIIPVLSRKPQLLPSVREANSLPLGAAFYLWEWSTALLCYALGVNPFDQPDVASAKEATRVALSEQGEGEQAPIQKSSELISYMDEVAHQHALDSKRYLALLCFLPMRDRDIYRTIIEIREGLAKKLAPKNLHVTSGFGPRYLHSTGQCHKGGPAIGTFVIITLNEPGEYPIPGANYDFAQLLSAQARGEFRTLEKLGKPVVHAHLTREEIRALSRALHATS